MKKVHGLLIAASITLFAGVALAGNFGHSKGSMRGGGHFGNKKIMMFEHVVKELDLTEKQTEEVKSAMKSIQTIIQSKSSTHSSMKETMASAIKNNDLTEQKIIELWNSHKADAEDKVTQIAKEIVRINAVLTDEQREKVAEKFESMHDKDAEGFFN